LDIADKAGLLGQLWIDYRDNEDFSVFMEYNDIGLPLSYVVAEGLVPGLTPLGEDYINETIEMFFKLLEITEQEVDMLDKINLDSVLTFAHQKRNTLE
jgi:hypothetical protein